MRDNGHVPRFIAFINWPTSRKVAANAGLSALLTCGTPWLWFTFVPATRTHINPELLDLLVNIGSLVFFAMVLLSLPAARAGREARWLGYVLVLVASPFLVALIYLFGTMSTPLVSFYPCVIIMWALYFDERIAWFGFLNMMAWLLVAGVLEAARLVPFAPLLVDRTVDAQQQGIWFSTMLMVILVTLGFTLVLCFFILAARRLQARQLEETHRALAGVNDSIRRYVPAQVAETFSLGSEQEICRPERRQLTVLSSDIQDFTLASDELDAEELAGMLNEYLSEMMSIADRHAATVSHVAGDGLVMLFGAPRATDERDQALRAVRMAQDMQARMRQLQAIWFRRGLERPFCIRIGINTGVVCVGDFGSEGRKLYSAIGVQANLAARIQSFCEPGRILMCGQTAALIRDEIASTSKAEIPVKHLTHPVPVYEVS